MVFISGSIENDKGSVNNSFFKNPLSRMALIVGGIALAALFWIGAAIAAFLTISYTLAKVVIVGFVISTLSIPHFVSKFFSSESSVNKPPAFVLRREPDSPPNFRANDPLLNMTISVPPPLPLSDSGSDSFPETDPLRKIRIPIPPIPSASTNTPLPLDTISIQPPLSTTQSAPIEYGNLRTKTPDDPLLKVYRELHPDLDSIQLV